MDILYYVHRQAKRKNVMQPTVRSAFVRQIIMGMRYTLPHDSDSIYRFRNLVKVLPGSDPQACTNSQLMDDPQNKSPQSYTGYLVKTLAVPSTMWVVGLV